MTISLMVQATNKKFAAARVRSSQEKQETIEATAAEEAEK
jgi:hypothetical protein